MMPLGTFRCVSFMVIIHIIWRVKSFTPKFYMNSATQEFRKNLLGLTDVTHSFFDKLVKQLERGFDSLEDDYQVMNI